MNRRVFLTATPGLALLTAAAADAQPHTHAASDPVIAQFIAEWQAVIAAASTPIARAELARRGASQLRVQAVYLRTKKLDESVRAAIRGQSIEHLIDGALNPAQRQHQFTELSKLFPDYRDDHASREAMRAWLQQLGEGAVSITAMMITMAGMFERAAPRMAGTFERPFIRPVQSQFCDMWHQMFDFYSTARDVACTFGILILSVGGAEACALMQSMVWMAQAGLWSDGC